MMQPYLLRLLALLGLLALASAARAQNVGIGTTSPTQTLDVNGNLRVRAAAGTGAGRLLSVTADGTLQPSAAAFGATPNTVQPAQPLGSGINTGGYNPSGIALNGAGTRAYVVNSTDNTLQAFDLSGPRAVALGNPISTGRLQPIVVAVNVAGTRAFVAGIGLPQVFDISREPAVRLPTVLNGGFSFSIGTVVGIALNAAGTRAYLLDQTNSALQLLSLNGTSLVAAPPVATGGTRPRGIALNAAGTRAYVIHDGSNELRGFDVSGASITSVGKLASTDENPQGVALSPDGTRAYVVSATKNTLQTFDLRNDVIVSLGQPVGLNSPSTTGNPAPSGVAISRDGTRAYIVNEGDNTLLEWDVSASQGTPTAYMGNVLPTEVQPVAIALNPAGTRAYVLNYGSNTLQEFIVGAAPRVVVAGYDGSLGSISLTALGDNLGNHLATQQLQLASQGLRFNDGTTQTSAAVGDNLGNHTATQNLNLASYQLVGNGGSQGLSITGSGNVGIGTSAPTAKLDVNGSLRLAVRVCPVDQTTAYALTAADLAYSIFKVQNFAFAPSLTLPPLGTGQSEGQELTILTTASSATLVSGANTDNATAVPLASINSSGLHAVKYVWALAQNGTGYWVRVQ